MKLHRTHSLFALLLGSTIVTAGVGCGEEDPGKANDEPDAAMDQANGGAGGGGGAGGRGGAGGTGGSAGSGGSGGNGGSGGSGGNSGTGGSGGRSGQDAGATDARTGADARAGSDGRAGGSDAASTDTWDTFGKAFMAKYCVSCHNLDKMGSATRDYTMLAAVKREAMAIACGTAPPTEVRSQLGCTSAHKPAGQFPVGGGPRPTDEERTRLVDWIRAGAP